MIRRFYAWLRGWVVVDLLDFDGEIVRRLAWPTQFGLRCDRTGFNITPCTLLEDGSVTRANGNRCFVKRWGIVWDYRR